MVLKNKFEHYNKYKTRTKNFSESHPLTPLLPLFRSSSHYFMPSTSYKILNLTLTINALI